MSAAQDDPWAAQLQIGRLDLYEARPGTRDWTRLAVPEDEAGALPPAAANVARLYRVLAEDLRAGTRRAPGFAVAHRLHRLIERTRQPRWTRQPR